MKYNSVMLGLTVAAATLLSGCVRMSKSYPINRVASGVEILPLQRQEYQIMGDTEGTACQKYLLGGKLPWFSGAPEKTLGILPGAQPGASGSFLVSLPIVGSFFAGQSGAVSGVVDEAVYEALDRVPGADALISVRIKMFKQTRIPLFYHEDCATVKGKAFQVKVDGKAETRNKPDENE
ncbi:MAG: hypothetical protein HY796_07880 [Elusimicrobia bacterium]|nr:hypothetical protein [Elusimicrobiota bacterium]